ncbi:DNA recombination protein RmuC [Helicobacter sp. 13S00477-4]|uniref:DNA recombination protein RmuC n=1 Tax=Helicobacter sp. 13S00477-4 TaxID=1905759 RepID=UPI000BA604B3|nr:DNA recombination protein RmuC [Helicobacter sp. 13S00477-4]PAF52391.1 hypothetical protein BKH44_02365 [Helicobacter sp. 13S00477-4]
MLSIISFILLIVIVLFLGLYTLSLKSKATKLQNEIIIQKNHYESKLLTSEEKFTYSLQNLQYQNNTQKDYYEKCLLDEREKLQSLKIELKDTEKIKKELKLEFENLSQKILKNKTQDFEKTQLQTLAPLQKEIKDFKDAFETLKNEQTKERTGLLTEIRLLKELNETISKEATNLTKALKGESKTRGNWGEMILESLLEKNGFIEGQNYHKQVHFKDEDSNKSYQPDIIIDLPEKRMIVIDAKLNLNAYDALIASETKEDIQKNTRMLLANIYTHFNELGKKKYHLFTKGESPDFTIMFIPIEGAFIEAMRADHDLFNKAYNLRIVITSPSTLMSILMTIANLWKNEEIDKDYRNIIAKLETLKDKMLTFCNHMNEIGKSIQTLQNRYEIANKSLQIGKGNIIDRIKKIQDSELKMIEE